MQAYSDPSREHDPHALPDIEVFYAERGWCWVHTRTGEDADIVDVPMQSRRDYEPKEAGWYWWPCYPGCLPDGDPIGPFDTEAEALADAREGIEDEPC